MFLSPCFISLLCTGEPCAKRERKGKLPLFSLSFWLTVELSYCYSFSLVNNAFSLHAYSSSTVCWKHFMKIRSCLKLKLISNLNLLAFYFSPSPFLILFDMQAVYTELIEFVFIFCQSFSSLKPNFVKCIGITEFLVVDNHLCNHLPLMSFGEDCAMRGMKKRWLIDLDICFAFELLFEVGYT